MSVGCESNFAVVTEQAVAESGKFFGSQKRRSRPERKSQGFSGDINIAAQQLRKSQSNALSEMQPARRLGTRNTEKTKRVGHAQ